VVTCDNSLGPLCFTCNHSRLISNAGKGVVAGVIGSHRLWVGAHRHGGGNPRFKVIAQAAVCRIANFQV
jgi:hypothetical protein